MKLGIKQGYKFDLICSYKFERGQNVFKSYVDDLYNIKKNSSNIIQKNIAKLMLNSLYGRFGMKDITSRIEIMNDKTFKNKINKRFNHTILSELNNGSKLVKYGDKLNYNLIKIIKYLENESLNDIKSNNEPIQLFQKVRGIPSAIQIAATISAYSKMSINNFKNIPNNECIYSDTDSVVLQNILNDKYIGKDIGQMKLEHKIIKGIFPRKKLYAIINQNDNLIIKASGADSSKLTYNDILELSKGQDIITYRKSFKTN
jgi:hypothetical protein